MSAYFRMHCNFTVPIQFNFYSMNFNESMCSEYMSLRHEVMKTRWTWCLSWSWWRWERMRFNRYPFKLSDNVRDIFIETYTKSTILILIIDPSTYLFSCTVVEGSGFLFFDPVAMFFFNFIYNFHTISRRLLFTSGEIDISFKIS